MNVDLHKFTVRLGDDDFQRVKMICLKQRKSMNFIINQAIREFLTKHKDGYKEYVREFLLKHEDQDEDNPM